MKYEQTNTDDYLLVLDGSTEHILVWREGMPVKVVKEDTGIAELNLSVNTDKSSLDYYCEL